MPGERAIVLAARPLERVRLLRHFGERLLERLDELRHSLLFLFQLSRGEVEERLVVPVQRLGRERAEACRELGVLAAEQKPGAACSENEAYEESDDHCGRKTLEIEPDGPRGPHKTPAPTNP